MKSINSTLFFSIALAISIPVSTVSATDKTIGAQALKLLEPITDRKIIDGELAFWVKGEPDEGRYTWVKNNPSPIYTPPKQTIYFVTNLNGDKAWLQNNGRLIELSLTAKKGNPKTKKEGAKFSRTFSGLGFTERAEYTVQQVNEQDDCTKIWYDVNLEVTKDNQKESKVVRYGLGC
ncbi:hypothetical protein [Paraherbaspirillum soli]|uniref:Uncharacterized protein n=1 Tax=Paraherbaspirillum soli TaxID=631222 RepID=A0ABW0MBL5_9BURK